MIVIGLDLATRICGVTIGDGAKMPACGAWNYDYCGADLGGLLEAYDADLEKLVTVHGAPAAVIYESPLLLPSDRLLVLRKIYSLGAYTELWAKRRGILCQEASAKALKKRLTGNHAASKDDMVAMCKRMGVPLPKGPEAKDAADSFAAWLIALTHHGDKGALARWDQALYGRRGALL